MRLLILMARGLDIPGTIHVLVYYCYGGINEYVHRKPVRMIELELWDQVRALTNISTTNFQAGLKKARSSRLVCVLGNIPLHKMTVTGGLLLQKYEL